VKVKILSGTVTIFLGVASVEHKIDVFIESLDKRQPEIGLSIYDRVCDKQLEVASPGRQTSESVNLHRQLGYGDVLITRAPGKVIGHYWLKLKAGQRVKL
jgi:hypothetical protein